MFYKLFDKMYSGSGVKSKILPKQQLPKELNKPIIRKFEKRQIYSSSKDNIWGADLADLILLTLSRNIGLVWT